MSALVHPILLPLVVPVLLILYDIQAFVGGIHPFLAAVAEF
jgi:hypothetical protein